MKNYFKVKPIRFKPIKPHFNLDLDRDGVRDFRDCQPFNKRRQDNTFSQKDVRYYSSTLPKFILNDSWAYDTISSFFRAPNRYKEKEYIKEVLEIVVLDHLHKIPPQAIKNAVNEIYTHFSKRYPKLTAKDEQNLKLANDLIEGRQSYGLREELSKGTTTKIFWTNGSAQWYIDRTHKQGDIVTLDANEIVLPFSERATERIIKYLIALPLYKLSFEAQQRGHAPENARDLWALLQAERMNRERGV